MIDKIAQYRKALAAFLVPALTVLGAALIPDQDGQVIVTASEWVGVAIAALGTSAAVAAIPNALTDAQIEEVEKAKHLA